MAKKKYSFDNADFQAATTSIPTTIESTDMETVGRRRMFNVAKIELSRIISRPQVRIHFDKAELHELADSLRSKGQQQPIRVWWDSEAEDTGRYVVLMGERRFRAAKIANIEAIEAVIHEQPLNEAEINELQLIENLVRSDLAPMEEARAFQKIIDDRKASGLPSSAKAIAKEIGSSETKVQRSVRLLKLPDDIKQDVEAGDVPPSVIRQMWRLKTEDQRRALIASYKEGQSFGDISQTVDQKKGTGRAKSLTSSAKTTKSFTSDGIKVQASSKKKVTKADIANVLRAWADDLDSDGRSRKKAA
jgi:ParB family chromosome partitioning protein